MPDANSPNVHVSFPRTSIDECCVLIPVSTLEDFPATASPEDARSLLAAWTVLWHPALLVAADQTPTWYRADSPPDLDRGQRIVTVPSLSLSELPEGFAENCRESSHINWIVGGTRAEMLEALKLGDGFAPLQSSTRRIDVNDFFALGYGFLQVQVMTRRLRYTSNLDELYFQGRVVDAAKAFLAYDAEACLAAMHDSFDALAQERDHYFASDPHLIDLTLLSDSTLATFLESLESLEDSEEETIEQNASEPDENEPLGLMAANENRHGPLVAPRNVLIDLPIAKSIANLPVKDLERLRSRLERKTLGWAGGGPGGDTMLDAKSFTETENAIEEAFNETAKSIGLRPMVYARYSGVTPSDMTKVIAGLGVAGMISIDFENGTGFGDEAKVLRQVGSIEIQTLTAKPIDATNDAAFLTLGTRLGESIDSGEIATGLFVRWPGHQSDSFEDLLRVASWCLVLGRFWNIDNYFLKGEKPYHHEPATSSTGAAADAFSERVAHGYYDPISSLVKQTQASIRNQTDANFRAMAALASSKTISTVDRVELAGEVASAIGFKISKDPSNLCIVNASTCPVRLNTEILGSAAKEEHVYSVTGNGNRSIVTIDVPAMGFSVVRNESSGNSSGRSLVRRLSEIVQKTSKPCAVDGILQNAFVEAAIDPTSGGIKGVYSGATRGNRFSMRLVAVSSENKKSKADELSSLMKCDKMETVIARADLGSIRTIGKITDAANKTLGTYELHYELRSGSRLIMIRGQIDMASQLVGDPWHHYVAARCAVATEAVSYRVIVRDKLHRPTSRRLIAPLGVLLDEAERKTLVASAGLAYHRRVDDRFLDTLIHVKGESSREFTLHYGFDVPSPVAQARSVLTEPLQVNIESVSSEGSRGWLLHASPSTVLVTDVECRVDSSGRLYASLRLIQTRSQATNATIRFCRNVTKAVALERKLRSDADWASAMSARTGPSDEAVGSARELDINAERVKVGLSGHEVIDAFIQFE